MSKNLLFAVDGKTEDVIISESPKGTNKVHFIERMRRSENEILYQAVITLTLMAQAPNPDIAAFKAMDKVCNLVYAHPKKAL